MTKLRVLDLFSGIGGFSLGLERTGGFETVAFCEIEDFPVKILNKHWPDVPVFRDVRELKGEDVGAVDVICGGFPCQDISLAGKRAGIEAERSGLWKEYARLVGEIRPRYVIVENTSGLLSLGLGVVLGDLAAFRYDAEWHCIPACYVGADHIRDRIWIIAYPADWQSIDERRSTKSQKEMAEDASGAMRSGLQRRGPTGANVENERELCQGPRFAFDATPSFPREYRSHKPVLGRGIHGIPNRVDRLKSLGNAVVPQIPELIGYAILEASS